MNILDVGATYGYRCGNIFETKDGKHKIKPFYPDKPLNNQLDDINLIIFGGGQDISPALYHHKNVASNCDSAPSKRDIQESIIWKEAKNRRITCLGICRGAQFLCVMDGGWLIQHVNNHAGSNHEVILRDDPDDERIIEVNSCHHQMMIPNETSLLLGYTKGISTDFCYDVETVGFNDDSLDFYLEHNPEIVLFSGVDIGFQCHPEYFSSSHALARKVRRYLSYYFGE